MTAKGWLLLALYEHPEGLETTIEVSRQSDTTASHQSDTTARQSDDAASQPDTTAKIQCLDQFILAQFIYDIEQNTAHFGSAKIDGPALRWTLLDGRALDTDTNASTPKANASGGGRHIDPNSALDNDPNTALTNSVNLDSTDHGIGNKRHLNQTALTNSVNLDSTDHGIGNVRHLDQTAPDNAVNLDSTDHGSPYGDSPPYDSGSPYEVEPVGTALIRKVSLDSADRWVMRCDRVDFSPAAAAHPHTHPGPGIRRLLFGELTVTTAGVTSTHRAGGVWFESGPDVVYAEASPTEETAFVRVMLLPSEWAGKRTIRYVDTAIAAGISTGKQRATILGEELLNTPERP